MQFSLKIRAVRDCLLVFLLIGAAAALHAQTPSIKACAVLHAKLTGVDLSATSHEDTKRIQDALHLCNPGEAVVLAKKGAKDSFLSAPLILPRGVTLFIEKGVTLYASRSPRDYDLWPESCGETATTRQGCKPFLFAYQAAYSGVMGEGTIDGQGRAWRKQQAEATRAGQKVSVPDLISSYESQEFSVRGLTLKNAAGTHLAIYKTIGLHADGTHIDAPESAAGVTGILLSNSPGASLSNLTIHVPGSAIDMRASILGGTSRVKITNLLVKGGKGVSLGDPVYGSVSAITVNHAVIENAERGLTFDLKGTQRGTLHGIQVQDACLRNVAKPLQVEEANGATGSALPAGRQIVFENVIDTGHGALTANGLKPQSAATCSATETAGNRPASKWDIDLSTVSRPGKRSKLVVAQNGSGDFRTIQAAVDALPISGGDIAIKPGIYREVVTIRKPHVHLHGVDNDPAKTEVVFDNTSPKSGGTFNSATLFVEADNVSIDHLTIANDAGSGKGQAVALSVTADRAVFDDLRLLGAQDTLFAASKYCYGDYGPCVPARQYFKNCYIAGNTDFIFGDSEAVFDHCELHGIAGKSVMYTAQSKHNADQPSGYVFDHCRLTADPNAGRISLGRPWRPHATVVYLNTEMDAPVIPAGWTEWPRFGVPSLPVAYYAEFHSTGPGADPSAREPYSHQLTAQQAKKWSTASFLSGKDGWKPMNVR